MADLQAINIGNLVNDGLGDDLRTAFQKVNANFADLNDELSITASNVGSTGVGIFKQKTDYNLEFKKLVSGNKMLLDEQENSIVVNSTAPDAFERIDTDSGFVQATVYKNLTFEGIAAPGSETKVKDIEVTASGSTIQFKTVVPVTEYLLTYDFGPISSNYDNAIQLALQSANIDFGTLSYLSSLNVDGGSLTA